MSTWFIANDIANAHLIRPPTLQLSIDCNFVNDLLHHLSPRKVVELKVNTRELSTVFMGDVVQTYEVGEGYIQSSSPSH